MNTKKDWNKIAEACQKGGRVPVMVPFTQEEYERIEKAASEADGLSVQGFIAASARLAADGILR